MENSRITGIIEQKNSSGVFELEFFLCRVERNLLKINEKSSTDFEKKKKDGKKHFL